MLLVNLMPDIKENGARLGVIACDIMKRELDPILEKIPCVSRVIYLEMALHCYPEKMKNEIMEQINLIKDEVDAIFLGYGFCQSLKDIEDEFDIPIVMPQLDDCIQILMSPQKYRNEIRKEVGTWFMTAGWAEAGAEMVIKETHSDRVVKYGKDPLEMAKRLFTHYRRGLFIDTHVGDAEHFMDRAKEFCEIFDLDLETTEGTSEILEQHLEMAVRKVSRISLKGKESARNDKGGGET